jgi:hypothetical protein
VDPGRGRRGPPAPAPGGFTVADFAARVRSMTGQESYTVRQAAYDLRKLRGKSLALKPGRSRRYQIRDDAARVIVGLLTLARSRHRADPPGVRSPRMGRKPATWTAIDRDYENLRVSMQSLFAGPGIDNILSMRDPHAASQRWSQPGPDQA